MSHLKWYPYRRGVLLPLCPSVDLMARLLKLLLLASELRMGTAMPWVMARVRIMSRPAVG